MLEAGLDDPSDISDDDPDAGEMSDATKEIIAIAKRIRPVNPDEVFVPYIVQSEVGNDGSVAEKSIHVTQVIARSKSDDLAILQTSGKHPRHSFAKLADVAPPVGAPIEIMGHIHHNFWLYREGVIGAYRTAVQDLPEIHGPFMQISANVGHGDSGSGAFNNRGELIGIASFIGSEEVHSGFYIHLNTIKGFLAAQHMYKLKIDTTVKDPDLGDATINKE